MQVVQSLVLLVAVAAAAWVLAWAGLRLARRQLIRNGSRDAELAVRRCSRPVRLTTAAVVAHALAPASGLPAPVVGPVRHIASLLVIGGAVALAVQLLVVGEQLLFGRVRVDVRDNRRARRLRTQITLIRRITVAVLVMIGIAAALMTFGQLRAIGTSLLASAGVAGVVAGLAAQSTLGNVFAGLQLAFSGSLRIDDVVVVESEWGRIEELTLTFVVVHLWDERRLVLPTSYFTTTPFQNWTRTEARVLGAVELHVDYTCPVELLRQHAHQVIEDSPLWDRRDWVLQVTDTTSSTMLVRVLASAADAPSAWDLRCEVREKLIGWLQREHPHALPRLRTTAESRDVEPAATSSATVLVPYPSEPDRTDGLDMTESGSGRSQFS